MTLKEISLLRLSRQHVSSNTLARARDVVSWMGGMQAQDYSTARWAIGARLPATTQSAVQRSIDKGEIIRTHVIRPTWHFVTSSDARWLLELTAPQIKPLLKSRQKELGLTSSTLARSINVLQKALAGGNFLTREQAISLLNSSRIPTHDQRASHILMWAELEMVICSGPMIEGKNTYALFDERVRTTKSLTREQSLKRLAARYFQSHGPATVADFVNWSGLPLADAKRALELISKSLYSEQIAGQTYWFKEVYTPVANSGPGAWLLPAFDEFIIGYKDRSACLQTKHRSTAIGINGMFWPVIVVNGQVIGLWKRKIGRGGVDVELRYFRGSKPSDTTVSRAIDDRVEQVRAFFKPE